MDTAAHHAQHRRALVETKIDGDARLKATVGKRAVQELPITDHHVTGVTHNWYRALKALAA